MASSSRNAQSSAAKRWCFTLNNYGAEEVDHLREVCERLCTYACIGKEVGANGTPHLQGYVHLRDKARLSQVRNDFSARAHFEVARGSSKDNARYCSKEGDVWSTGVCPGRDGAVSRDDLAREYRELVGSRGLDGVAEFRDNHPGVHAWSGHILLRNYLELTPAPRRDEVFVEWIYGGPGVGKSRLAYNRFPGAYRKCARHKWWTGYMLEKDVVIDDYGPKCIDLFYLLTWFDRYPCSVETKGSIVPLCASNFIVTSNFHPSELFVDENDVTQPHKQLPALMRRITVNHMLAPEAPAAGPAEAR